MTRKEQKEEKRQKILMTALTLFVERGYYDSKITDITSAVPMSTGLMFHYFESKEELLLELVKMGAAGSKSTSGKDIGINFRSWGRIETEVNSNKEVESARIRKEEEGNNRHKATQRPIKAIDNNQNRNSINGMENFITFRTKNSSDDDTNSNNPRKKGNAGVICWYCIVGIISMGLGMIFFGLNHDIPFITIFGIFDFIIFFVFFGILVENNKIILFKVYSSLFFYIYFITLDSIMFLFSITFTCIDCCKNQVKRTKLEKKKMGIIIIFLNTIMGGLGTLIFGLTKMTEKKLTKWTKIKDIIFGIIQLIGFILLLYSIFLLPFEKNNYSKIITLIIFGCLSYCFSLYSGINIYKELKNN